MTSNNTNKANSVFNKNILYKLPLWLLCAVKFPFSLPGIFLGATFRCILDDLSCVHTTLQCRPDAEIQFRSAEGGLKSALIASALVCEHQAHVTESHKI